MSGSGPAAARARSSAIRFAYATAEAGIGFRHVHGGSGARYMVETMGGGGGFADFDGDGWLDLYLVQSGPLRGSADPTPRPNALYRNRGDGAFEDVTAASGAGHTGYGMGACFGDVDNDGDVDIYVTNWGPDALLINRGDGAFADATAASGVDNPAWATSCAMADYDRDGCLDVYVVNYVRFSYETHQTCRRGRIVGYCHPDVYPGVPDVLYRGRCDGRFTDVSDATGIANRDPAQSKGLGVAWTDYDGDGDVDVYVANDSTRNFLYRNDGARFTDVAIEAGAAYNDLGATEAGMGVAPGDYDGDGDVDVFVTHLDFETNTLYQNRGDGSFFDATTLAGLAGPSVTRVGFGAAWADFDLDGDLDLFVANGHILDNIAEDNSSLGYAQANQVFENDGGRLRDVTIQVGDAVGRPSVSRAAAVGDYDNDGDLDVLVVNSGGPAQLLRNETQRPRRGVSVRLVTRGRDAIGARARLIRGGGPSPVAEIYAGSSYLAQRDPRLVFGLPDDAPGWRIEIRWPDGAAQTVDGASLKLGAVTEIRQGEAAR